MHYQSVKRTPGQTRAFADKHLILSKSSNQPMTATRRRQGQQLYAGHGRPGGRGHPHWHQPAVTRGRAHVHVCSRVRVRMHSCAFVRADACMCLRACAWRTCLRMRACAGLLHMWMHKHACSCAGAGVRAWSGPRVSEYIRVCARALVCVMCMHVRILAQMRMRVCVCAFMSEYTCICICAYTEM